MVIKLQFEANGIFFKFLILPVAVFIEQWNQEVFEIFVFLFSRSFTPLNDGNESFKDYGDDYPWNMFEENEPSGKWHCNYFDTGSTWTRFLIFNFVAMFVLPVAVSMP